ncbi:cohesin loading factor-domain-containing protein [Rhizophagus diaphanus]|nr:cohesin loading factor-domain-containing protein [Rhizophagus diaphanus] [Rhizophagus sp. MUCL 43196]
MEYSPSPYNRSYESNPFVSPQNSMSAPLSQNSYHMTQQLPPVNQYAQPQISQQQSQQQLYQHQLQQQFAQQQLIQQSQQPVPITLSEHLAPARQLSQPIVPTQALPQAPTQINVYQQTPSSQFSQKSLQEPQLLPHQLLWYLAEHYLTKASALPTSSLANFPTLSPQHQRQILAAINCLEAVLKSITNGKNYMTLIELKTRFRLSQILFWFTDNIREAENHIQKAILLSQELDKVTELKFRMIDFQCNILKSTKNFKAAKNLMKSCIVEAIENNIPNWTYHFLLQCAEFHYIEGDFNGCSKILKQAESMADQKGDVEMKACLLISMAQYAFSSQNYPEAQHALAELSTVYFPPPSSRPPPTYHIFPISNQLLYLHFSLLFITYHMHTGNMKQATEKLTEVHQILDQKQDEVTLEELKGYTTIHISAAPTTSMTTYANATTAAQSLPVTIRWLSKAEIYTLTFLISGICNRGDTSTIKSIIFLTEGLKIVEREIYSNDDNQFPIYDVIKSKKFYVTLKAYMLQHLVDSYLMRSDFDDAEKAIAQLINWITEYNLWAQFHVSVTLALGMINQCVGKTCEAIEHYKQVEKIADNREIRILSKVNRALIMVGSGNNHHQDIGTIIKEIKQELVYQTHNIDNLRAALHFLEALSYGDFTRTKEHLAETLKLSTTLFNNQLKSLTLSILGEIFCAEHNEQAEKMLSAAYQLSKDANNNLGCLVSGRLLKDIYRFQHNQLNYTNRAAFNEQHELAVQKTLANWSEKRRVVLDLIENDGSKSSSTPIIQHNSSGENSMGSSNTNMMHSVPGGGGYV